MKYLIRIAGLLPAIACSVAGAWVCASAQPANQQVRSDAPHTPVTGTWEGLLDAGAAKLKLIIHIASEEDGSLTGTLDSPDQNARGLPMDSITFLHPVLRFEMKSLAVIYEGRLGSADATTISGEFKQAGQAFELGFERTGETAAPGLLKSHKVDAGGHKLNFLSGGEGTPTVVFEAGFGSHLVSWSPIQSEIAQFAKTVSYDRAGLGLSEIGPKPRSAKLIATELHTALQNAGMRPPYVLVGHSLGGIFLRVFADLYPKEVAGMVLIDPSQEAFHDWTRANPIRPPQDEQAEMARVSQGVRDEHAVVPTYYEQARSSKLPAGIPVVLLTAMKDETVTAEARRVWVEKHAEWIAKVPGGKHIKLEQSGHFIQGEQPEIVIDAIKEVVDLVRNRRLEAR